MKEFVAVQTMAGTYAWQGHYHGEAEEARQQGLRLSIHTSCLSREAALNEVAENLADQGEQWLCPVGQADGFWLIYLDRLPFPSLSAQKWLLGERTIRPEFDVRETEFGGQTRRFGVVTVTVVPQDRELSATIPSAPELAHSIAEFRQDHADSTRCGLIMMPFTKTPGHEAIAKTIRETCDRYALRALRVDDQRYSDDLFPNIRTYMHGCGFGVAVFERLKADQFNPNVSLEVGYMLALGKPVCLLKDETLPTLPSDLIGRLYENFDTQRIEATLPVVLAKWLREKGLVSEKT